MVERGMAAIKLGEIVMILDLHRQGLSVSAIAGHSQTESQDDEQTRPCLVATNVAIALTSAKQRHHSDKTRQFSARGYGNSH
jgi:hypothetical protein